ncbi:ISAs1 family transposase, partial [Paraburkholderia heleia]|uniref:ISAs1 family transposase n=1 Tax=Paraburkholderia heleia TaxID=634127 RepID=UPI0038B79810
MRSISCRQYGCGLGVMPGQVRTAEKSNEITAIPEPLDALMFKGAIVTIDAMGCQQNIAGKIVDAGAHYVLSVKENQPTLPANMREPLEIIAREPQKFGASEYREVEKGHGH